MINSLRGCGAEIWALGASDKPSVHHYAPNSVPSTVHFVRAVAPDSILSAFSAAPRSSGLSGAFGHVDRRSVGHLGCFPALLPTFGKRWLVLWLGKAQALCPAMFASAPFQGLSSGQPAPRAAASLFSEFLSFIPTAVPVCFLCAHPLLCIMSLWPIRGARLCRMIPVLKYESQTGARLPGVPPDTPDALMPGRTFGKNPGCSPGEYESERAALARWAVAHCTCPVQNKCPNGL